MHIRRFTPSSICQRCWVGPLSRERFREAVEQSGEIPYTTTGNDLRTAAKSGCGLCRVVLESSDAEDSGAEVAVQLFLATMYSDAGDGSKRRVQLLRIRVDGKMLVDVMYYLYTSTGQSSHSAVRLHELCNPHSHFMSPCR